MKQNCPFECNRIMYKQNVEKNNDLTKIQGHVKFPISTLRNIVM